MTKLAADDRRTGDSTAEAGLKVFVTVDVEWWPSSWETRRSDFRDAFDRYILGRTSRGTVGLPFQLSMARDHGLRFVFFVESLFACEFGVSPLEDIVQMILEAGQEVQLHAHPEWIRHAAEPLFDTGGRHAFCDFSEEEQLRLITKALGNLSDAGATKVRAFRAGSFAGNIDTLSALARAGLTIDSSFKLGAHLGAAERPAVDGCFRLGGVSEYPLSVFRDWPGHRRHVQLGSCSAGELMHVVRRAGPSGWPAVVVLSHSAELLNEARTAPDRMVMKRFERFCRFLSESADARTAWLGDVCGSELGGGGLTAIDSPVWRTLGRMVEQGLRRV